MTQFIKRLTAFIIIPVIFILVMSLVVPATPRASESLLFTKDAKDQLLANAPSPRLILVGGSNLSYGLYSAILEEGLDMNVINAAIHVTLGAKFMLDSTLEYVRPGDVVVIALEYPQFYGNNMYGGEELLRTVLDVDRKSLSLLNLRQWMNIAIYLPEYAISKITPSEYNYKQDSYKGIYVKYAFNEYGDAYYHWTREPVAFEPHPREEGDFK